MPGKGKNLNIAERPALMSVRIGLVMTQIADEVDRQFCQWGVQDHAHGYRPRPGTAVYEEACKRICDVAGDKLEWQDIIDEEMAETANAETDERVYEELVQVAACIVSCLENMSRNRKVKAIEGTTRVESV